MLLAIIGSVAGSGCMVLWAGSQIASPSRRELMPYHLDLLSDPEEIGMVIAHFSASDGTPCLICEPHPSGESGERGKTIREQLSGRGLSLPPPGTINGTLVLCHGRKGRKEDYLPIASRLCAVGFRCILFDMPAHGDHPQEVATYGVREASLPVTLLHEASAKFGFDERPAGLLGMSMGGSVAVHSAAEADAPWMALVVISSFDSFAEVTGYQASKVLGDGLAGYFSSAVDRVYQGDSGVSIRSIVPRDKAAEIGIPTMVAHGSDDEVVPLDSGRSLFDAFPNGGGNKWVEVPGAGHDNVLVTDFPIYAEIAGWMLRHVKAGGFSR
nr:alpha/beta hydrolase [Verrucomicrobiota bacterium JB025]